VSATRIALASNALGLGGTEKGLEILARTLDRERFDVRVVGVQQLGPREASLREAGIAVECAESDPARLADLFRDRQVVHVFRQGNHEPLVPEACRAAGVPVVVETNIFGNVDSSPDERLFACHLFISKFCLLRYRGWVGDGGDGFHDRHRVLYLPIEPGRLRSLAPERAEAKRLLGLDPERPVVSRIGRAADGKWRNLLVDMVPPLLELRPDAQVMFVGDTPAKRRRLARLGMIDRVRLEQPVIDEARLAALYAASDVFVAAAEIGESQGLAIAEAMALGVPVVTSSTPWVDNAQVELVDHGRTGYVANHPRSFAEAVAALLGDDARREAFGRAARADSDRLFDPGAIAVQAERLYSSLVAGDGAPAEWSPSPREVDDFAAEYERRSGAEYRVLKARERAGARFARARERTLQRTVGLNWQTLVPALRQRARMLLRARRR
jgi:glycosyltransferase involved in cell wall biosynthesis